MSGVIVQETVNTATHAVTFVTKEVLKALLRTVTARGLDVKYIDDRFEALERGLRVWLAGGYLKELHLEVFLPGANEATEAFRYSFAYNNAVLREEGTPVDVRRLENMLAGLHELTGGHTYRIVVVVSADAPRLDSWEQTELRPVPGPTTDMALQWGYGPISAGMSYQGHGAA